MPLVRDNFSRDLAAAIAAFAYRQPSSLLSHAADCCLTAKEWFLAMDSALRNNGSGMEAPRWLRDHFEWGPSRWPLYWCEVVRRNILDCGGLAALARESFKARGVVPLPTQLIRVHSEDDARQWKAGWEKKGCPTDWVQGPYVYHEAVAVVREKAAQVWDPSESFWIDPELKLGYATSVAIRVISASSEVPGVLEWGKYHLVLNSWISLLAGCRRRACDDLLSDESMTVSVET